MRKTTLAVAPSSGTFKAEESFETSRSRAIYSPPKLSGNTGAMNINMTGT